MKIDSAIEQLEKLYPEQKKFKQAVKEVLTDIAEYYEDNEDYQKFNILGVLAEPDRILRFRVQWQDDEGNYQVNRAWRVQYNNTLGAYKGGIRFHPSVDVDTLKFLAFEQCFKNALTGFPMGGAKGGSDFNPKGKSRDEIIRFCHAFMDELYRYIGPETDVPAGDIGVGSREIGYMFGRYVKIRNRYHGAITGKNPSYFGSCMREEATGYGSIYMLQNVLEEHGDHLKNLSINISGSGNVALFAAEKAIDLGAKVQTLSDSDGTLFFSKGMNPKIIDSIKTLKLHKKGRLRDYNEKVEFEYKENTKPWNIKCEVALPCATENEIQGEDAQALLDNGCRYFVEGANMPLNSDAQELVRQKKVVYVPGKIANAGGVAISNLERSQNAQLVQWSFEEVDSRLKEIMKRIHSNATSFVEKDGEYIDYQAGANLYAFKKIADAIVAFGVV